ncbi:MAG: hypothetical protein SPD80_06195 [Atopobium sp.]|uniref:hypothetical protein n=1 Tax=Atopobium sp. TaxID=1872650 RepID=UPI002A81360F|nr:hypothetical protein [Atopobium sp.]MDY4523155.1 hypothetical protein [Atopobium sp.]
MKRYSTHPAVYAGLVSAVCMSVPRTAMAISAQTISSLPGPRVIIPAALAICAGIAGVTYAVVRKQRAAMDNSWQTEDVIWHRMNDMASSAETSFAGTSAEDSAAGGPSSNLSTSTQKSSQAATSSAVAGAHAARDYEQIAQNYVDTQRYKQRVAIQQQGVKVTLLERLGARFSGSMMDGLPIIERADGSVGDVGTTWWEATVGPNITRGSLFESLPDDPTVPQPQTPTPAEAQSRRRHAEVVSRVAHLDLGMYPERRESEELSNKRDMWELALAALDEKLDDTGSVAVNIPSSAPKPVVASAAVELTGQMVCATSDGIQAVKSNSVSTIESGSANSKITADAQVSNTPVATPITASVAKQAAPSAMPSAFDMDALDEPDFLEPGTEVLHFRAPANHPEITDEKSYVAYLISDEEEKARSKRYGAHAKKYDYLRVIDGGTSTRLQVLQPTKKSSYKPRHMKHVPEATEPTSTRDDSFVMEQIMAQQG